MLERSWCVLEKCGWVEGGAEASLLVASAREEKRGEEKGEWYGGNEREMVYRSTHSAASLCPVCGCIYINNASPAEPTPSTSSASEVFNPAAPATFAKSVVPAISLTFVAQVSPQVACPAL